ncbi:hypothetical protein [Streptomyces sp. SBT349]|uniref:hypothetical protein n=1 Tax=Streptomyces sp. SBT349 TaxID=1580539 RepID=UPI00066C3392|nr:hypothetical protein [Streptomyces sp. SBT349]
MPSPHRTPGQRLRRREIADASAGLGRDWHDPDPVTAPPPLGDEPPTLIDGRACPPARAPERCPACPAPDETPAPHGHTGDLS